MALKKPIPPSQSVYSRRFCSRLQVLPCTENAAMLYGSMQAALECIGRLVGIYDLQVAVHARSHGLI